MSRDEIELPFSVARSSRKTLVEQVVEGLRRCIVTGRYKPGDTLPPTRDLAERLGVSRIVTRAAVRELAEAGLVNPKPSVGCIVLGQKGKLWKGTVLFVTLGDRGDYYTNRFSDELGAVLLRNGWRFQKVASYRDDTSLLELEATHLVDIAVMMFGNAKAEKVLSQAGIPFVAVGDTKAARFEHCLAAIPFDREAVVANIAARALSLGVKDAWQVGFEPQKDLVKAFAAAKIPLKEVLVSPIKGFTQPEATVFAAQQHFEKRLAKGSSSFPELLYFSDDYVCQGALLALARHGIEAPRDVKVVTWSNKGNGPYYFRSLARVELAPQEDGRRLAAQLLGWLSTHTFADKISIAPDYVPGETF